MPSNFQYFDEKFLIVCLMIDLLFAGESSFVVFEMFVIEVRFGEMEEEDQVNDVSQASAATTPQFSAETKQNTFKKQVVFF